VTIGIPATWSKKRERWESPDGRFFFDIEAADKACDFFPTFLTHHIGGFAGKSFELMDWQRLLAVRPVFGWKNAETGYRRFRFLFLFVPKANGKSPLGSGLGLILLLCDDEPAAEVFSVATDKDQAKVVHESAKIMVEQSADLSELVQVLRDSIYCPTSRGFYKAIASDAAGSHGGRPHGVIIDEFHTQKNRDLFEALRKSMLKRRQPLLVMLSHAGDDEESICFEEYEVAKRVLNEPALDAAYLPVIFEAGPKEDWTAELVWKRTNPGYGVTVNPTIFAAECKAAQDTPRKRNDFLKFNLNRWVGQATAWIPIEWWDNCEDSFTDNDILPLACAAGLDMAQKIDLVAFVVVFRQFLDGAAPIRLEVTTEEIAGKEEKREFSLNYRIFVRPFFWLPEETVRDREKEGITSYRAWAEAGLLTITEGAAIDYDKVFKDIRAIAERYPLLKQGEIGYDPAFATDIANRLRDKAGFKTVEVLQNYTHMNEPCQVFEALVKAKRVVHDGHRLMRWNVENVAVKTDDARRVRPVKPKKPTKKIDGVVASLMGLSRLMAVPEPQPPQDYAVDWIG
jgi:phage terminase large subunit-like protein